VSWYEAAAYAAFAGKSLPTLHEWWGAAQQTADSDIVTLSNFGGHAAEPVGERRHGGVRRL
jgi:eukaryotic-like serine/threonine-protein kinase